MPVVCNGVQLNMWNQLFKSGIVELCYMYIERRGNSMWISRDSVESSYVEGVSTFVTWLWSLYSSFTQQHSFSAPYKPAPVLTHWRKIEKTSPMSLSPWGDRHLDNWYGVISEKMKHVGSGRGTGEREHSEPGDLGTMPQKKMRWVIS